MEEKVENLMTRDVITIELPATKDDIIDVLKEGEISSVPLTKNNKYRGLLSRKDLLEDPDEDQLSLLMDEDCPTVSPNTSVQKCGDIMVNKNERRIPVIEDLSLKGIITVTDIVRYIAKTENKKEIGDYLSENTLTIWEKTPLNLVAQTLKFANEPAACILNKEGEFTGIITELDCIKSGHLKTSSEVITGSLAEEDDNWMWEGIKSTSNQLISISHLEIPKRPVKEYMTKDIKRIVGSTSISETANIMIEDNKEQLPVMSGKQLIGLIKDINLIKCLISS